MLNCSDGPFLTVADVAELLKVNPQTVRNWIDRGELPAVRVGARRVRVRQDDLEAFIAPALSNERGDADDPGELRATFADALEHVRAGIDDDVELAIALRSLAEAATRLARALEDA